MIEILFSNDRFGFMSSIFWLILQNYAVASRKALHNASGYFHDSWILPTFAYTFKVNE